MKKIIILVFTCFLMLTVVPYSVYADDDSFVFEKDSYEFTAGDDEAEIWINFDSEENVKSWASSNEFVATFSNKGSYYANLDIKGIGNTTITATGENGSIATCNVTIIDDPWHLEKTSVKALFSDESMELEIYDAGSNNEFTVKSSNTKVVKASMEEDYACLSFVGVGTSTITVTDKFGKTATCTVTIMADPFKLDCKSCNFDSYNGVDDEYEVCSDSEYNDIASVKSSNTKVANVTRFNSYYFVIKPVGAGTATITATDQFGQTATVLVSVTQKFADEIKYLNDLESCYIEAPEYGDTRITVYCDIVPKVYTTINNKKYTGSVDENGNYVIRHLPKLSAGSKITVYLTKGQAVYKQTIKVEKKAGRDLTVKVKNQNYTGKALKPKITIKHGKYVLKKGTDYKVKCSNNKKIGRAKVTITFKGNYKGQKAAYFNIRPKGTSIVKLSPIKGGFKVKWKKRTSQVSGYQIQYGYYDNPIAYGEKKTVKGNKTNIVKITDIWGDKYQVRVRTYKTVKGKKYYSVWSKIKTVKPKY